MAIPASAVAYGDGAGRASNDADFFITPSYEIRTVFPRRLQGQLIRSRLPGRRGRASSRRTPVCEQFGIDSSGAAATDALGSVSRPGRASATAVRGVYASLPE